MVQHVIYDVFRVILCVCAFCEIHCIPGEVSPKDIKKKLNA